MRNKTNIFLLIICLIFICFCSLLLLEPLHLFYAERAPTNSRKEQKLAHYLNVAFERSGLNDLIKKE